MRIALLRHGRTDWNIAGRLQGRSDIPLSDEAGAELRSLALPPDWHKADILTSPLSRARETAAILAAGPVRVDDALVERHLGAWEGKRGVDLSADPESGYGPVETWGWNGRPPGGGETPREVLDRVAPVLDALEKETVIVSHINIMRVLLARAYDWHFDGEMPFRIKRNRLYVLSRAAGTWRVEGEPVRLVPRCA